jgi:chemotaxis protein CheZ
MGMAAQRKIFRIEESAQFGPRDAILAPPAIAVTDETTQRHHELMTELMAVRVLLDQQLQPRLETSIIGSKEVSQAHELKSELDLIHEAIRRTKEDIGGLEASAFLGPQMARVGRELDAVISGTEQATQNILNSAEDIDQIANTLSSLVSGGYAQGLAQDMRDHVVRIFEACNFQDLTGQRIGKVVATLKFIEDHINRMLEIWRGIEGVDPAPPLVSSKVDNDSKLLNGPKLPDDPGHASQADIDSIFDSN